MKLALLITLTFLVASRIIFPGDIQPWQIVAGVILSILVWSAAQVFSLIR